jgi:hypothetical protein
MGLLFVLASCSPPEGSSKQVPIRPTSIAQWDSTDVANPYNPYDSIGYYHNLCLDYAGSRQRPDWNNDSVQRCVVSFMHQQWGASVDSATLFLTALDSVRSHFTIADSVEADSLINLLNSAEFHRLGGEATTIADSEGILSRAQYLSGLKLIEDTTTASLTLNSVQKRFIYWYCSVLRYSYAFWHSAAASAYPVRAFSKNTHVLVTQNMLEADGKGAVFGAAGGFVTGGVTGAIYGSVLTGGTAGWAGAAGGAMMGSAIGAMSNGAGASVATAIGVDPNSPLGAFFTALFASLFTF